MREERKTIGDWIFHEILDNVYLKRLYSKLIVEYTNKLQGNTYYLEDKYIKHLLRFADLLSKSDDDIRGPFHKNLAQNIVCILEKMYPDNALNKFFMGSVLSNVNNYIGLEGKCPEYRNLDMIEEIIEIITKETYRIPKVYESNMFFDSSQSIAFNKISNEDYYSFSGPTSMGKTFLVKVFVKTLVVRKFRNNYVIVVPSKALINEVKSEIINAMGSCLREEKYKVITTPSSIVNGDEYKYIMIYTQERLSYQIKLHNTIKIDYVFIDEAQKISEIGMRSVYFYKVINHLVRVNSLTKIFFLCPYIPNPQIYLKLVPNLKENEKKFDVFEFSPVNQHKSIVDLSSYRISVYSDLTKEFIDVDINNNQYTSITEFIYHVGRESSNIVFCDSKKDVEKYAIEYWKKCNVENNLELQELIKDIKTYIHPKSFLVHFLKRGICCHVGYLPSIIKAKIEHLFRKKIIKTIFCTSTLLEGVNLPADNLFILIKNNSYIIKNSADFKNLMGRVGRKTYNLIGNVYVIPSSGSDNAVFERCRELIEKPVENQKLSIDEILNSKLKKKIVKSLLNGTGAIDKGVMTYETFGMARFIVNILIKCILEDDRNNYIFKVFSDMLDDNKISIIKENFKAEDVTDDSNVTADQLRNLDKEILEDRIKYPSFIKYSDVKNFLEDIYELFHWDKYESKKEIGKKEKLSYYAVLLNQWMHGHSVKRIIDESIEYHKNTGEIFDDKQKKIVAYTGSNSQDNSIVVECLTAIEDVLLFSISNYFAKFSERYKILKKVDVLENDWSEYIDFGTNDRIVIELQKVGFSREIAKIIEKNNYAIISDSNTLSFSKRILNSENQQLRTELEDVKLNYAELFRHI